MESMYDELDELKEEVSKLREECLTKTEICDSLRKGQAKQVEEIELSKLEIEKLALELNAKTEVIQQITKMHEELQSDYRRKDLLLQQISSATEKLQGECSEKILKLEAQNRDLVLSLEEASARIEGLEKESRANSEEISGLKMLLSKKMEQNSELEKRLSKDLKERDEYMQKLEEEVRITRDKLKWKNEQFMHLEEAHGRLQAQFHGSKIEWEKEKSALIDEISSLHATLGALQVPESSMEDQLRITNQALAREERKRKALEIALSQCRSKFEEVSQEHELAKSQIKQLILKRDEEIAKLWIIANKTKTFANEMRDETAEIEQGSSAIDLTDKEAEWNRQIETLCQAMNCCVSELGSKSKKIKDLEEDLEHHQCLFEVKNEESHALVAVLKSEIYVAHADMHDDKEMSARRFVEMEEKNMILNQKLQTMTTELHKLRTELNKRCGEMVLLMDRVEFLDSLKQTHDLEKESYMRLYQQSNCTIESLKYDIAQLKEKCAETEANNAALSDAHNNLMQIHEEDLSNLKDRDQEMIEKEVMFYGILMKAEAQRILEIEAMLDDLEKASSFIKDLLAQLEAISIQAEVLHLEDVELKSMLDKMLHVSEEEDQTTTSFLSSENSNSSNFSPPTKSFKVSSDERTPLAELNFEFLH